MYNVANFLDACTKTLSKDKLLKRGVIKVIKEASLYHFSSNGGWDSDHKDDFALFLYSTVGVLLRCLYVLASDEREHNGSAIE